MESSSLVQLGIAHEDEAAGEVRVPSRSFIATSVLTEKGHANDYYHIMTKRINMSLELAQLLEQAVKEKSLTDELRRNQVVLGKFPQEVLTALKISDLDVVTSVAIIAKIMKKHELSAATVAGLHELICNPVAVYDSATEQGSVVVLTMRLVMGDPIIAAIAVNTPDAFKKGHMHWLTSAYPKENHAKFAEWERDGLLRWRPEAKKAA